MANPTMTLIASNTVGSGGVSSVTFSSIPSTYTDLIIKTSLRSNVSSGYGANAYMTFNGSTSGYSDCLLYNINLGVGSANASNAYITWASMNDSNNNTANTFGNGEIYIPNYTSSNYKSVSIDSLFEDNSGLNAYMSLDAAVWSNTSPITSITLTSSGTTFAQYSTAYLYGIKNS